MRLIFALFYIAAMGVLAHEVGEKLPRAWFDPEAKPYAPFKWERGGRIYDRLAVRKWKDRLPDMSKIAKDMVPKSISLTAASEDVYRVAQETCVAETVHWLLAVIAIPAYLLCRTVAGRILMALYAISNLPFIIIQRYNRPKLVALSGRLKLREERKKTCVY